MQVLGSGLGLGLEWCAFYMHKTAVVYWLQVLTFKWRTSRSTGVQWYCSCGILPDKRGTI